MTAKSRFALAAALMGLLAIGACDTSSSRSPRTEEGSVLGGAVTGDVERPIGSSAKLNGYSGTVTAVEYRRRLTAYEDGGFLVVDVAIRNSSDETRPYHFFDWRLQTPDGEMIDPTITSLDHLRSGDLQPGEGIEGTVVFELPDPNGDLSIVYKPVSLDSARALWKVNGTLCMTGTGATPGTAACPLSGM